jgi:hypothetical protein
MAELRIDRAGEYTSDDPWEDLMPFCAAMEIKVSFTLAGESEQLSIVELANRVLGGMGRTAQISMQAPPGTWDHAEKHQAQVHNMLEASKLRSDADGSVRYMTPHEFRHGKPPNLSENHQFFVPCIVYNDLAQGHHGSIRGHPARYLHNVEEGDGYKVYDCVTRMYRETRNVVFDDRRTHEVTGFDLGNYSCVPGYSIPWDVYDVQEPAELKVISGTEGVQPDSDITALRDALTAAKAELPS